MSINQSFLIEVEKETANTRRLISNIDDKHLQWAPHEKSMAVSALVGHIVELHNWVKQALTVDTFNLATDYVPFKPTSIEEALSVLNNGYEVNKDLISKMEDSDWQEVWTMQFGDHIIAQMPRIGALRLLLINHLIHHRGQLSVYLRLLDIPVPGIYGPSADDRKG